MIDVPISDSCGNLLLLTTDIYGHAYDAVTCSPRTDGGFSLLYYIVDRPYNLPLLEAACAETATRNEVCILPSSVSSKWRVLLTPSLRSRREQSRQNASRLMKDLFGASQARGVAATRVLITNFHYVIKYPEAHVLGIFDAIKDRMNTSFLGLKVVGFDFNPKHWAQFEQHLRGTFAAEPGAAGDAPQAER